MKKSVILDIFNGIKGHRETMNMPKEKFKENMKSALDADDVLQEKLNPELLALYHKLIDTLEQNWSDTIDFYFVEAFKLGLLIGIECMEE